MKIGGNVNAVGDSVVLTTGRWRLERQCC